MTGQMPLIAFALPGGSEWIVILVVGLLIFGRRLPEVARNVGKSVNEFKKGIREFQDSANEVTRDVEKIKRDVDREVEQATADDDEYDPYGTGELAGEHDYYDDPYEGEEDEYGQTEPSSSETTETTTEQDKPSPAGEGETTGPNKGQTSHESAENTPESSESAPEKDSSDSYVEPMK